MLLLLHMPQAAPARRAAADRSTHRRGRSRIALLADGQAAARVDLVRGQRSIWRALPQQFRFIGSIRRTSGDRAGMAAMRPIATFSSTLMSAPF